MSFFSILLSESAVVERLGWVLVHSLWQIALIAMVSILAAGVLHRNSSVLRYGLLVAAMGFMVAASIVTYVVVPVSGEVGKGSRESVVPENVAEPILATTDTARLTAGSELPPGDPPGERSGVSPPVPIAIKVVSGSSGSDEYRMANALPLADLIRPWLTWIVGFWCIGMLISSLRPLLGWRTLWRLRRIGLSAPTEEVLAAFQRVFTRLGMRRVVNVYHSTLAKGPLVVGYLRPIVLLPVSLTTSIPTAQLEAILAHELAHIRRHDFVINLLQTLVETLFFYHPAVWWLSHRIRVEREHCCDDLVIKLFNNAPDYGRALLAVEQLQGETTTLALGAKDGSLLGRIRRIVSVRGNQKDCDRPSAVWISIAGICSICVLSATWSLLANDETPKTPQLAVATLPGNVTIELVGVTVHTSKSESDPDWWTPSGSPLPKGRIQGNPFREKTAPAHHRIFDVEVKGLQIPHPCLSK
ncbi:MAG: M56 family metallopeptidase [Planctomycetaceae bacterium]